MRLRLAIALFLILEGYFRSAAAFMDLYPTVSLSEFPVIGLPFTIEVNVYNEFNSIAQSDASSVVLEFQLPPELQYISCSVSLFELSWFASNWASPATVTNNGGNIRCELGTLHRAFRRPVYITVQPTQVGTFDCTARVSGQGAVDYPPNNNYLQSPVQVHTNGLYVVGGQAIPEQSGEDARFQVRLIRPSTQTVTVEYATVDGTATAGQDYAPASGVLVFPPGVTNQNVFVHVLDDSLGEMARQTFALRLTNAINADASPYAEANEVVDNEPTIQVSISNAPPVLEGYLTTNLVFGVHFSGVSDVPTVFTYATTGDGTFSGMYTNPPGLTDVVLTFPVDGNITPESNRVLNVTLSDPYLLSYPWPRIELGQATAQGVIVDDDGGPGDFHHMELGVVPSPQIAGKPFPVYLFAKDAFNNPATNYLSDRVELVLYRVVNFSSAIIQVVYVSNFVDGVGMAMMTSTNPQARLNAVAWKPVGQGYATAIGNEFRAIASPPLFLSLGVTNATEGDGTFVGAGRVSITNTDFQDVVVELDSADFEEITIPPTVIIPAGQTSAVFNVTIVDDSRFDGTRTTGVAANSIGYLGTTRSISVSDNEPATLTVMLPEGLSEAKGFNSGTATVQFSRVLEGGALLSLFSSNTAKLIVPGQVWVFPGETSTTFPVTVPNNAVIDGPQTVSVGAVFSSMARGWASTVVQDEDTNITLFATFGNDIPIEGSSSKTNILTAKLGGVTTNDVTVSLQSSHPDKIVIPASITIPAGQLSSTGLLVVVDDFVASGDTRVTLTGSAPDFLPGVLTLTVYDNDAHHFQLAPIPIGQTSGVPFTVSISARGPTNAIVTYFRGPLFFQALADGVPLPVTPITLSNGIRGTWNSMVKIDGWGTNVQLIVTGPGGSPQTNSNPFSVAPPEWATHTRIKELRRSELGAQVWFESHTNGAYQLQATTNLSVAPWIPLGSPVIGIGAETYIIDPATPPSQRRFYRLEVGPR